MFDCASESCLEFRASALASSECGVVFKAVRFGVVQGVGFGVTKDVRAWGWGLFPAWGCLRVVRLWGWELFTA